MDWLGLGKVSVPTPGSPAPLSATRVMVGNIMFSFDMNDGAGTIVTVYDRLGKAIFTLSSVNVQPVVLTSPSGNQLNLAFYSVDCNNPLMGPYVCYSVD